MRRIMLTAAVLAVAASGAQASEPKSGGDKGAQYIDISQVAVPIVAEGRLVNYIFVQVRLNLASSVDAVKMREKEPYLRDALVRTAHRSALAGKTDYLHVDEALLKSAITRDVTPVIGARNVTSVEIIKQNPKQRTGVPRPKA